MPERIGAECNAGELLRAIAWRGEDAGKRQISSLAEKVRDWDAFLNLADEHRISPMLFPRLVEMGAAVPPVVQKRMEAEYRRNVFHRLANAAELIDLLKAFDGAAIPAMPFKGVVLAASIYPDPTTRSAGDLDLLIPLRDLSRATAILLAMGYELKTATGVGGMLAHPDVSEYRFERTRDGMVTELRWRLDLIQGRYRRNLGMDWVWPRRRTALLVGAEVPDMAPEVKLLMLCMHGSKHAWSRLLWICDIAQLLVSTPGLDWKATVREARQLGLWRSLALGTLLGHGMAGAPVPAAVLQRFKSDRVACGLTEYIRNNLLEDPGSVPSSRVPYNLQMLALRDRIGLLLSLDILRPNELDRAFVPLPKELKALYYLIRPFRILRDRSAR